jgi:hypothetical protein
VLAYEFLLWRQHTFKNPWNNTVHLALSTVSRKLTISGGNICNFDGGGIIFDDDDSFHANAGSCGKCTIEFWEGNVDEVRNLIDGTVVLNTLE